MGSSRADGGDSSGSCGATRFIPVVMTRPKAKFFLIKVAIPCPVSVTEPHAFLPQEDGLVAPDAPVEGPLL